MENIAVKYSTLSKLYLILIMSLIISFPFIYGISSISITFLTISITGTGVILLIKSTPLIKYISISIFWVKAIILLYLYNNANIYIFPDSHEYIKILNDIIGMDTYDFQLITGAAQTLHVGFYYVYLVIYQVFDNALAILLTNTLFTTLSAILFYKIFKFRFNHKIAFMVFVLFSLSANIFIFGSFILKDPIVMFLIALSLYLYLNKNRMFFALLISLFLITVRIYSGFAIIAAIIIDYLIFSNLSRKRKLIAFFALFLFLTIIFNLPISQGYLGLSTSFLSDMSIFNAILIIPSTLLKFFFSPLPWNIFNNADVYRYLIIDSITMLLLSFSLIVFIFKWFKFKELRRKYYIFLILILVHAFALGVEYGGDSTRQRSGIFVFLLLTFILGIFYKERAEK